MSEDSFTLGAIFLAGCFTLAASCFNWRWFMNRHRARFIVQGLGYQGARIFYGFIGLMLAVFGLVGFFTSL
ncbi:MAG: immunity 17 family protein [Deinococcota bacterium]